MSVDSYSVFQSAKFFKRHRIKDAGLRMEQKPFSIGVRMEHPQALIDAAQYGEENAGKLPPADYRINHRASNGRGVYSFCMCPGGEGAGYAGGITSAACDGIRTARHVIEKYRPCDD